jgi:hypothetical protein
MKMELLGEETEKGDQKGGLEGWEIEIDRNEDPETNSQDRI